MSHEAQSIRTFVDTWMKASRTGDGDWAWYRTHLVVTMTPPGGGPVRREGYTLTVARKNARGEWTIARDANLLSAAQL
jgi:ketosteroid isomerase-like protein